MLAEEAIDSSVLSEAVNTLYEEFVAKNRDLVGGIACDCVPFKEYRVEKKWKPSPIGLLLVSEAPPWHEPFCDEHYPYFYNINSDVQGLGRYIFKGLHVSVSSKERMLETFAKKRNAFLIDVIKCPIMPGLREELKWNLARLDASEFEGTKTDYTNALAMLILGRTALECLKSTKRFSTALAAFSGALEAYEATVARRRPMIVGNTAVFVSPLPTYHPTKAVKALERVDDYIKHL